MNSFGIERATTIRYPSTANVQIDSNDRESANPWNFQISKSQAIQNGFFSRIATTEVVLEWYNPNIDPQLENTTLYVDISGTGANTFVGTVNTSLVSGFYTVAQALDRLAAQLTDLSGSTGTRFFAANVFGYPGLVADGGFFRPNATLGVVLANQLGLTGPNSTQYLPIVFVLGADLRPYRYLDFTSSQLTYNQDLKDNSTAEVERDVLCRWYFSWDTPPELDTLGIPILMGYTPFVARRLYNPPKQIKWDPTQPLGNLAFEVFYTDRYKQTGPVPAYPISTNPSNWLMTLQLSEN